MKKLKNGWVEGSVEDFLNDTRTKIENPNGELLRKEIVNGKETTIFDLDVFDKVLETSENALEEAKKILKKVKTNDAKEWLKKYKSFIK